MTYTIPPEHRERDLAWLRSPEGRAQMREFQVANATHREVRELVDLREAVDLGWVHFAWLMLRRALARTRIWPFTMLWP